MLLLGLFSVLKKPRIFISVYLFVWTGYLGLATADALKPFSFENLIFLFNCFIFISLIWGFFQRKFFNVNGLIIFYLLFFLIGIFYPFIKGQSGLFPALADGKDFLCILLAGYLFQNNKKINYSYLEKVIYFYSIIISLFILFYVAFGVSPPGYEPVVYGDRAEGIHVRYSSLVGLAFILSLIKFHYRGSYSHLAFLLFNLIFLMIQPHKAVFLTTLGMVVVYYLLLSNIKTKLIFSSFFGAILALVFLTGNINIVQDNVVQPAEQVVKGEGVIGSRLEISALRISLWLQEPEFGYGFIDKNTPLGSYIESQAPSRFSEKLGVVDAGYIDLLVRFGYVGLGIFLLAYLYWFFTFYRSSDKFSVKMLSLLILSFLLISVSWSVMTYLHGIVVLSLAFYFIHLSKTQFKYFLR